MKFKKTITNTLRLSLLLFVFNSSIYSYAEDTIKIVYPSFGNNDERGNPFLEFLKLALNKSNVQYTLSPTKDVLSQERASKMLATSNKQINILWMGTSKKWESELLQIPIPLYRGLSGYRLFLIDNKIQYKLNDVKSLKDLTKYSVCQGIGWSDIPILENSGFNVVTGMYDNLFSMVTEGSSNNKKDLVIQGAEKKKCDLFSRSIMEIEAELKKWNPVYPSLAIESSMVLKYRFDVFFFVNKKDVKLKSLIENGFHRAYDDGSFMKLFNELPQIKSALDISKLAKRKFFTIPNPTLSNETNNIDQKYWEKDL